MLTLQNIGRVLGSRAARNSYVWIILLWFTHSLNISNDRHHQLGLFRDPSWYWWVMITGLVVQITMVYTNNLILVPRLLVRGKRWTYAALVLLLVFSASVLYTIGLKLAAPHIRVDDLQQVGMVAGPIHKDWSVPSVLDDMQTYMTGNLLWLLVFTMAWYMNDYARQRRLAEQAQQQQVATELSFLKSQLNPHFLFNTLNNLYALALKKSDEAPDAILQLSAILRYLIYESNNGKVPFEKEKEIMQAYISLELLRLKDKDNLRFTVTADGACDIPPLLWLPVLENVFKHGTRIISADTPVDYRFTINGHNLQIFSSNQYREGTVNGTDSGIGMANLRKRLSLLYPDRHTLSSGPRGTAYITEVNINLTTQ